MSSQTPIDTVEKLAGLARLRIPEENKAALATEFDSILTYISQLNELTVATDGTPAMPPLHNVFRADENPNETGAYTEDIVRAFPSKSGNALSVKKIITHD